MSEFGLIVSLVCLFLGPRSCLSATTTTAFTTTGNSTGSMTTTNSTMTSTSNSTSNETLTTTAATTTTTTIMTTTTKPPFDVKHNTELALYVLKLTVGTGNTSEIQYLNSSLMREELLSKLSSYFKNISFSVALDSNNTAGQATDLFILSVKFMIEDTNSTEELRVAIRSALASIDNSADFNLPSTNATDEAVNQFFGKVTDICSAENVCPLGFSCNTEGCQHMCREQTCSNHGMCYTSVDSRAAVATLCQCDMEYATEYLGDKCQYSRRGRLEIIAIIAGVLGAACLIFIIVIIVLCVMYGRHKSSSNYNLSGASYANKAYDNTQQK